MAKRNKLPQPWWKRSWEMLWTAWGDLLREWNLPVRPERRPQKRRSKPRPPEAEKEEHEKDRLGRLGEDEAARFLKSQGYRILERNIQFRLGELDMIAQKGNVIAFVEVKTRRTGNAGQPFEVVNPAKMRRIVSMAEAWLRYKKLGDDHLVFRFDIISIVWPEGEPPEIQHFENAFDANAKYRRITR